MPHFAVGGYSSSAERVRVGEEGPLMDPREQNGRLLAHDKRIKHIREEIWFIPSQTATGGHIVNLLTSSCSCDDFELSREKCKHIWAAEIRRSGTVEPPPAKAPRPTYKQDWPVYNAMQCDEKRMVMKLLRGLCEGILSSPHPGRGPKPLPLGDVVYGMTMKVYVGMSARRATSDIRTCAEAGHISRAPRASTVLDYFDKPEMTALLKVLIEESAAPLACVESQFAADSTGFSTSVYRRWFDAKYGRERSEQGWVKAHAMVGTKTHVVTAVTVTESGASDSVELPALLTATKRQFELREVSADKAYLGHDNLEKIEAVGAVPYIPFKSNSLGEGPAAWQRLWGLFMYQRAEFLAHYHRRSNVESTFSAVKRKFGGFVRSRNFVAQTNEVLCKLLCHNLACLVQASYELNIKPMFDFISAPEVVS